MTGVSAIKAASGRHPHVAYQDGSEPPLLRLMTQPLDKHDQVRVAEITALIGAHHLIIIGLYRQLVGANDAAVGKATDRLCGAGDRMSYFLPRVAARLALLTNHASSAIAVFSFLTSVESLSLHPHSVPDGAVGDPSVRSPAWLLRSALRESPHTDRGALW